PARLEPRDDDLERVKRLRRQQGLAAELSPRDEVEPAAAQHARPRGRRAEEVGHVDAERGRESLQRRDRRVRPPALELAEEALADAGRARDLLQRLAAQLPDRAQALAELDVDRCCFSHLQCRFSRVKRLYDRGVHGSTWPWWQEEA